MKAFTLDRYGKDADLRLGDVADPLVQDNDVLIEIHTAGVNQLDNKIRDGEFKPILPYRPPFVLGHDVAGTIVQVGANVTRFSVGDAVYARPRDGRIGTFAEKIAVDQADLAIAPRSLTMEEAASIPLVGLTAWQALVEIAKLKKGQKIFIQAGSGGVGTFAIQLAKYLGAVVATTTSAANIELVQALGADVVIDYRTQDFEQILSGYDVVLHSQDNEMLRKSIGILKPGGIAISISGPPDPAFARSRKLNPLIGLVLRLASSGIRRAARRAGVRYAFLFMSANGDQLANISALIDAGAVRATLDKVFPFTQTNEALAYVHKGRAKGKVVIKIR
ncbi:NADPH:quinone oxidoreductase [Devosia yakushimensis]|uniref:NADPH:quinone oxidoreductase n=1 Tax=Devosia yakushimensis TaxID=470028 RepID=A0ABQ5UEV7_9HYPH|nr:NADP-dependent oxidoreductase [Devosia yakushimensis]GLQ09086.1 NADPH:quinone oxidoreductase [Devosia yakushimensis]